jgi:cysteine-rich repeat protein
VEYWCVINNGLAPPYPVNVIDDAAYSGDTVFVRNVGCPPHWGGPGVNAYDPCPNPGGPTEVDVVDGGAVLRLLAYDSSTVTISAGQMAFLAAADSSTVSMSGGVVTVNLVVGSTSTVTMSGGTVQYDLEASGSSTVTISGGTVGSSLYAYDHSTTITIEGNGFAVDGEPVPYGDLDAQTGSLTGTLASLDPIDNVFYQGGGSYNGTITLVFVIWGNGIREGTEACDDGDTEPGDGCDASCQVETGWICTGEPSVCTEHILPTLSPWSQLALMAGLLGAGLGMWRWWSYPRSRGHSEAYV